MPTPERRIAVKRKAELQSGDLFILRGIGQPYYYYSFDVPNKPLHETAHALMTEGRNAISEPQDQMSRDNLHITLWYKTTPGPDKEYEAKLAKRTPTKVTVTYVYGDGKSTAVAAVSLRTYEKSMHKSWYLPHISLYKDQSKEWNDLGKIVQQGENVTDWIATSVNTWASASTGLSKKALFWQIQVQEGIHLHVFPPNKRWEQKQRKIC